MDLQTTGGHVERFSAYLDASASVIGPADRAGPLRDYCTGLSMPAERKSVEPMAAMTAPTRTAAQHQSLLHFVGRGNGSDEALLGKIREIVLPKIEAHGPITAWIIDDTGFPKKDKHSVGVARQYCGQIGKQDNCQVAVSLSIANAHASLPVAYRMYLPEAWTDDTERREKAGYPLETSGRHYSARNLPFRKLSTPRRRRCALSATSSPRLPRCAANSRLASRTNSTAAPAAVGPPNGANA